MIAIIDYGAGNLKSVAGAFRRLGQEAVLARQPPELAAARGLVLPGVGAFGQAMTRLTEMGLDVALQEFAASGKPFLGICLGLQLLFTESEEHGRHRGLDLLPGRVVRFPPGGKVPHMGWNEVRTARESPLFAGVPVRTRFYFAHSYYAAPADDSVVLGRTDYGFEFASAVGRGNVFGLQFHPEKSAQPGLRILENFRRLCGKE